MEQLLCLWPKFGREHTRILSGGLKTFQGSFDCLQSYWYLLKGVRSGVATPGETLS